MKTVLVVVAYILLGLSSNLQFVQSIMSKDRLSDSSSNSDDHEDMHYNHASILRMTSLPPGVHELRAMEDTPTLDNNANPNNVFIDSDDVPIEIRRLSSCELCKSLIGAAAGNFLEWFDFAIFGLLADEIGHNFFPKSAPGTQLLQAFAVYAGAFLMRPLGGAMFGWIGDKFGRLTALRISIFMMAIPTFLTGCLPTYHDIGITSTVLLVLLRLIQGLSVGGEITGALVYVLEICPQNRRSLFGILVQVSGSGTLLAIIVEATMRAVFSDDQIYSWAWRIPFLSGIVVAGFGVWIRRALPMSGDFLHQQSDGTLKDNPIKEVLWNHKVLIVILVCHISVYASSYYTIYVWLPVYLYELRSDPVEGAYAITVGVMIVGMLSAILGGYLGDKVTPIRVLLVGGSVYLLVMVGFFPIMEYSSDTVTALLMAAVSFFYGFYSGPYSTWAIDQLGDAATRYTALGIGYNISLALFGGTAPLLATAVETQSGIKAWSWVLFTYGVISLGTDVLVTKYRKPAVTMMEEEEETELGGTSNETKHRIINSHWGGIQFIVDGILIEMFCVAFHLMSD